jgi:RNA polymerase sigma factor (sigma-70 family)
LKFRKKSESELSHLDDDDLVAYMVKARNAGDDDEVRLAVQILLFQRQDREIALLALKTDNYQDAEDIWSAVMEGALKARFRGQHAGQFFSMVKQIRHARLVDYYDGKRNAPLLVGPREDGSDPLEDMGGPTGIDSAAELQSVVDGILEELSERDRMVVRLRMAGYPAKETAERVAHSGLEGADDITSINCDTIFSRFRKALDEALKRDEEQGGTA